MALIPNIEIKIDVEDKRGLGRKLLDAVANVLRDNFSKQSRDLVIDQVDRAVKENKHFFIPSVEEAAELGIGEEGSVSDKRKNAWQALLASESRTFGVTKVSVTKSRAKGKIGEIRVTVDWDKFFDDIGITKVDASDSEIGEIPWMKWFIEGMVITGSRFKSGDFKYPPSRTGKGVMIPGAFWDFEPHPMGPLELTEDISKRLTRLASKLAKGK
jgi:hypothetical protein